MSRIVSAVFLLLMILVVPCSAQLISGAPFPFDLTTTGLTSIGTFTVPPGATRLEVRMTVASCEADVSLYVRFETPVTQDPTGIQADVVGNGPDPNTIDGNKIIVIRKDSSPPLREGIYYIAVRAATPPTSATVIATLDSQNSSQETLLSSGIATAFSFGCAATPTLFNRAYSYRVNVPPGSTNVQVKLTTDTLDARVDLYVRAGSDVARSGNNITYDPPLAVIGADATKPLSFTPPSSSQTIVYFIALRLMTLDTTVKGSLIATVACTGPVTPPVIGVSTSALTFNTSFGANPPSKTFTVRNSGGGTLTFRISSNVPWLTTNPTQGSSNGAAFTITVNVNVGTLNVGTTSGQITVSDQGTPPVAPVVISVTLVISAAGAPQISVPSSLDFGTVAVGQSNTRTLTIGNAGAGVLTVTSLNVSNAQFALTAPPATPFTVDGMGQRTFPVTFTPSGAGAQTATLTIGSNDQVRGTVTVSFSGVGQGAAGTPIITVSATSLVFTGQVGGTVAPQTFTVSNTGSGTLSYQVTTNQSWLVVSPSQGATAGPTVTHTVTINTAGLAAGAFDAQIRIAQAGSALAPESGPAQVSPVLIAVRLTLTAQQGTPPTITRNSLVNAASFRSPALPGGSLARGGIFSMFGNAMGPAAVAIASAFPLQTTLAGASVKVTKGSTSVDAIPLAVVATQINAILPSNTPLGEVQVTVTYNGRTSAPVTAQVVDSSFGLFTVNQNGMGPGIFQNFVSQTETPLNSPQRPARRRQFVIGWGTGLFPISGADNVAPPVGNLSVNVDILVGGARVINKTYSGRAPCCAGLDQVVFEVPADAPLGCYVPVVVTAGNVTGNIATMAISEDGGPCSDPLNPLGAISRRGGKLGVITLARAAVRAAIAGQTLDLTLDVGTASFSSETGGEYAYSPITSLPPLGSCTVIDASGIDLSGLLGGQLPMLPGATPQQLNAGSPLTVTGSGGTRQIPRDPSSGAYFALLGSTLPLPGQTSQPLFLNQGSFTIAGPGGPDVGSFTANLTIPSAANWTNRDQAATVTRSQGYTFNWTGGDPARQGVILIGASVDQSTNAGAVFVCTAPLSAGSFTVSAAIMSSLPPTNAQQPDQSIGALIFAVGPSGEVQTFTAPGLNAGVTLYSSLNATATVFR
ncbi:MAG: choice-of-anchor D domain-containing protein [Acidobacteria bacterium]|nr:choice-of-anchor D domain-containing protein [Acidobacteriota bacterium]